MDHLLNLKAISSKWRIKLKILYVTTISNTINAFLIPHIEMLVKEGHQVDVAFKAEQVIKPRILELGCKVFEVGFNRSPFKKSNYHAYRLLKKIITDENYDIVHTHTPVASTITRLVCKNIPNIKVIYTAHGFHFFKGAPLSNWLIYYPIEKYLSKFTDILITINKEDYNRAKTSLKANRVEYVPGVGIDIEKYRNTSIDKFEKRTELGLPNDAFVLLSVGELNKNKNHEVIIKAISNIRNDRIHYIVCGEGGLLNYLSCLSNTLGIKSRVHFIGHRDDLNEIYKASDVFIFPSLREGLPVSMMEAMASGLPVISSRIRGCTDLIDDGINGHLVTYYSVDDFSKKILSFFYNEKKYVIGQQNQISVKNYSIDNVLSKLRYFY